MLTLVSFVVAIALLIAVHEFGHYRMALACGVKVLRFSIGFGKPLLCWQSTATSTEFVLAAVPLGGFVKMLDEREGPVDPAQRHLAFNTQPLLSRTAIVAAGPIANLLLAVVLYAIINWSGVEMTAPVISHPQTGSVASQAGLVGGERVLRAGLEGAALDDITSFEDLRWLLTRAALASENVALLVKNANNERQVYLKLAGLSVTNVDAQLLTQIGLVSPYTRPVIGETMQGGVAQKSGLLDGDEVLKINGTSVVDGQQLRQLIRQSAEKGHSSSQTWVINRHGRLQELTLTPAVVQEGAQTIGKIGAYVGTRPETVWVTFGLIDGLWQGVVKTWDISVLTLKMMGKMLVGEASIKNISGPLTIADYAGKSAGMGLTQYLVFLALISVSLGVLNLLPLPVLDGGHLMYYLWEGVTGKPVSDAWMERLQQGGVALLMVMMSVALFNDISRLFIQ